MIYLSFYSLLRRIARADYTKREEYRRHVTMITTLDDGMIMNVDIDLLTEYYERTKKFKRDTVDYQIHTITPSPRKNEKNG